jgi:pyrimidine-specific ribonucleoside hydrolase
VSQACGVPESERGQLGRTVLFEAFPTDPDLFLPDLRPLVQDIIARHGPEEWKICVLTNETHHHLGIYALIGAKMGLKAREELAAGFGALQVVSFAGRRPPISCFNDGLQLSTGSTLGHGSISVADNESARVEARFLAHKCGLVMQLKAEYRQKITDDIERAVKQHGDLTPAYFAHVRQLALRYWLEFSRRDLFDAEAA